MDTRPTIPPVLWEAEHLERQDQRDDLVYSAVALAEAGICVSVWPTPPVAEAGSDHDDRLISRLDQLCRRPQGDGAYVSIVHSAPELLRPDEGAVCTIGRTAVGTLRVPEQSAAAAAALDEIWVPSTFSGMALAASGVPEEKIQIVPSSIEPALLVADPDRPPSERGEGFTFMTVLDWDYLRGLDIVLEAYVREFGRSDDVLLVLKIPEPVKPATVGAEGDRGATFRREMESWLLEYVRGRAGAGEERKQFTRVLSAVGDDKLRESLIREREAESRTANEIRNAIREEMRPGAKDIPEIRVVSGTLPRYLMPRLYSACDAFVMAPRAERWGRPFLEAMAVGLPTIGTRWGGHLDFMRPHNSFLIRVRALVDIHDDDELQRGDQRLAEPDVEHLRELMRRVFEYRSEAQERAALGAAHVKTRNSPARVGALMAERLAEIAGDLPTEVAEAA